VNIPHKTASFGAESPKTIVGDNTMRRLLLVAAVLLAGVLQAVAQYPHYTIRQIQEVSADSLRRLDTLQRTQLTRWTAQTSPHFHDTVTVRGVCVVPAKVIGFTSLGYNLLIVDPENPTSWGGLLVRPNISGTGNPGDTVLAIQWGMLNVEPGDTVELTGYIDEFPASDPVSATQIVPLYSQPLNIFPGPGPEAIPPFIEKSVSDFFVGPFPAAAPFPPNGIKFSTGEPMEFMRIFLTNLVVTGVLNGTNGTFVMSDQAGNSFSTMDASKWFTTRGHRDPASTYALPAMGMTIDTIRGYVLTNSGQEAARGYRIAPLYPGDIVYGSVILPTVSTHRRYPIVVPPDSTPLVTCRVNRGSVGIQSAVLHYSVNNGSFVNLNMTRYAVDSTYRANIPQQAADAFVKYYITITDSAANTLTYASSAVDGTQRDTLRGFFFYNVLNRDITIRDVQQTPFSNGRTPYLGALVTLRGIVTADTNSMLPPPSRFRGSSAWYMQSGNAPWSGIWVYNDTLTTDLLSLQVGDSVAITGTIQELSEVTAIRPTSTTPAVVYSHGNPVPAPVVLPTNTFGPGVANGTISAEQYESMLVQFNNVVMPDSEPTYQDIYEYALDDGTNPVLVRRDGTNHFTTTVNDSVGKVLIRVGDHISFVRGIVFYAGGGGGFRYKFVPRSNADFGTLTSASVNVSVASGWNMISNPVTVVNDSVRVLYPTSINPYAFAFSGGYVQDYTMENGTGYWAKFPSAATQQVAGLARVRDSIAVVAGWNMVGTISGSVDTSTIVSVPAGIRASNWFGYAGGYTPAVALAPGQAYWVKARVAGKFVLAVGPAVAKLSTGKSIADVLNSITITDANGSAQTLYFGSDANNEVAGSMFVMPPQPPAGAIDARFPTAEGGSMVQIHPATLSQAVEFPVMVQSDAYPVTVSWNVTKGASSYQIADGNGGKTFRPKTMAATGSMELRGSGMSKFSIQVMANGELPKRYALDQNYPNPFNPSTTIKYDLPKDSKVSLKVFDILGREVSTLVNGEEKAGFKSVEWNGTGFATGVYFFRLQAGDFTATKKLLLLK
jgi:hypothetical protein